MRFVISIFIAMNLFLVASASATGVLRVGVASVDVTPEIGVPLGGFGGGDRRLKMSKWGKYKYATYLAPSTGVRDPIRSKAMVLEKDGKRLLFVSLDVVGVTSKFLKDLHRRFKALGFKTGEVVVSATHTHSGPGTLSNEWIWQLIAMDRYQPVIYNRFADGVVESVVKAVHALEPADLYATDFLAKDLQKNRRIQDGDFDPEARLLMAWGGGRWLGGIVNFAVHGTALGTGNHKFSADMPGGIERGMETELARLNGDATDESPTVLFINGAEGDVSPAHGGETGIEESGAEFSRQALAAFSTGKWVRPEWKIRQSEVNLGGGRLNALACMSGKSRKFISRHLYVPLGNALAPVAGLMQIDLGGTTPNDLPARPQIRMMSWPGEPTTAVGRALKAIAAADQIPSKWVLGLTNGHMAYFTTPEEFRAGGYEACMSLYGKNGSVKVLSAHQKLSR